MMSRVTRSWFCALVLVTLLPVASTAFGRASANARGVALRPGFRSSGAGVMRATSASASIDDDIPGTLLILPGTATDALDVLTDVNDVYRVHLSVGEPLDVTLFAPPPSSRVEEQWVYRESSHLSPPFVVPTDSWLDGEMLVTTTGVSTTMDGRSMQLVADMDAALAAGGPWYLHVWAGEDYSAQGLQIDWVSVDGGPGTPAILNDEFDSPNDPDWVTTFDTQTGPGTGTVETSQSVIWLKPDAVVGTAAIRSATPVISSLPARIRFRVRYPGTGFRGAFVALTKTGVYTDQMAFWMIGTTDHDWMGNWIAAQSREDVVVTDPAPDFDLYLLPPGTPSLATAVPVWGSTTPDTSDEAFTYVARTHGDYYLVVNAYAGSGEYTLSASTRPVDPDFEIPGVAHSLPFADADTLDGLADMQDVRAIYLKAGERVDVLLSGSSGTDFDTYLFGPEATSTAGAVQPLAYSVSDTSSERMSLTARTTGTHYLVVDGRWTAVAGTYTLSAMRGISDPDGDIPGTARTVPFVVNDALDPMLDPHDVSRVYLVQGQRLDASLWFDPGSEFDARLYGPLSTTLAPGLTPLPWTGGAGPSAIQRSWVADRSGYYYLDVSAGVDSPGGLYSLQVTASTPVLSATAISIRSSASSVRYRVPFRLTGVLTPGRMGDPCVVEVRKPGSARWSYSSARLCYSETGAGANWWYRYTPLLRGTYTFRVRFAGDGWRLACRSPNTVAVRVR